MYNTESINSLKELESLIKKYSLDFHFYCEEDLEYIFIVSLNSLKIAIIEFSPNLSSILWFEVFPEFRKQGHGIKFITQLLCQFEQDLIIHKQTATISITPLNENIESFWRKCGFIMTKNHPTMSVSLNSPK